MHAAEVVLGYDAREAPPGPPGRWPAERRSAYLLRADVDAPLSTDTMVWPPALADEPRGSWDRPLDLWPHLAALLVRLAGTPEPRPHWVVAVTLVAALVPAERRALWEPCPVEPAPAAVQPAWSLLGYDVSDRWLLSGLSNCGYTASEAEPLRRRWGARLNRWHLFDDVAQAGECAELTSWRVREHAPFFVYGLYRVE
jgi:hypothetical protein